MVELDEATRRALLAREGPPPTARAEILAGLRSRLGDPGGPEDPGDSGDPGDFGDLGGGRPPLDIAAAGGQLGWAAKVVGATIGLTTAGLLAVKLVAVAVGAGGSKPELARAVDEAPVSAVEASESATGSLDPAPAEAPPAEPEPSAGAPPRKPAQPGSPPLEPATSTLAAELELVRAAKQLRADDPEAALAKLELHAERFAAGSLAPERDALRVELLCALDRRDDASKARAQFLAAHTDSPLRARVLASCDSSGTDTASAGD